jgi:hypothetical protein
LEFWKRHSKQDVGECSVEDCHEQATEGAIVCRLDKPSSMTYVIPMCQNHAHGNGRHFFVQGVCVPTLLRLLNPKVLNG